MLSPKCSTPFGINEVRTNVGGGAGRRGRRAQRLSASTKYAPPPDQYADVDCDSAQRLSASTKYAPDKSGRYGTVVSCSTPFGINEVRTGSSPGVRPGKSCAQRLSASTKYAPARENARCASGKVLNAFRHQRSTHYYICCRRWVMRAKSAQRLSASTKYARSRPGRRSSGLTVLNAFRHQRSTHGVASESGEGWSLCSTPFGINEVRTGGKAYLPTMSLPCSTPFGINEVRTEGLRHSANERRQCSTPFGINEVRTTAAVNGSLAA